MAFVENDGVRDWFVLFRSFAGNGSPLGEDPPFPQTSLKDWVAGDTNVLPPTQGDDDGNFKFQGTIHNQNILSDHSYY